MIVSVTEIMNYLRCRRLWRYTSFNQMSLTPATNRPAFFLGSVIHGSLEDWLISEGKSDLVELFTARSMLATKQAVDQYTQVVGAGPSPSELTPLFEALQLGKGMMTNYQEHYRTPIDYKLYHLIKTEQIITVPIDGSLGICTDCGGIGYHHNVSDPMTIFRSENHTTCETCKGTGKVQNFLEGILDGIIADRRDRLLILEHKTYNSRPRKDALEMNFQFIGYQWGLTKLDMGTVLGLAYDGMWKRDGKQTPEELFTRMILTRTKWELEEFEQELCQVVTEMSNNPYINHHVPWNGCWDCGFINLCKAESKHEGYQNLLTSRYIKRERTQAFVDEE